MGKVQVFMLCFLVQSSLAKSQMILPDNINVDYVPITFEVLFPGAAPKELSSTLITMPPRAGSSVSIGREHIERIMKQHGVFDMEILGANRVQIHTQSQLINSKKISIVAKDYLKSQASLSNEIEYSTSWNQELVLPQGDISFRILSVKPRRLSFINTVWVGIDINGKHYQTVKVKVYATHNRILPFARIDIEEGTIIEERHLTYKQVNALEYDQDFIVISDNQLRSIRSFKTGDPVFLNGVAVPPDVEKGEKIKAITRVGRVEVQTELKVLEDGFIDSFIHAVGNEPDKSFLLRIDQDAVGNIYGTIQ